MQVTNLSKTVNLFIIGLSILLNITLLDLILDWKLFDTYVLGDAKKSTVYQAVLGILGISAAIFLGLILESITDIFRQIVIVIFRKSAKVKRSISKLLFYFEGQQKYEYWKEKTYEVLSQKYPYFNQIIEENQRAYIVAHLFAHSSDLQVLWVTRHHAAYLLSTCFLVLALPNLFLFMFTGHYELMGVCLLLLYLLARISLDKKTYAYNSMFRFVYLHIMGETFNIDQLELEDNTKPLPTPPSAK